MKTKKRKIKGFSIQFMPHSEIKDLDGNERVKKILKIILGNNILILQGKLRNEEEARLIGDTMAMIGHIKNFKGIELAVISGNGKEKFLGRMKTRIANRLSGGDLGAITIIGPTTIVKEIKRNPKKIELFLNSWNSKIYNSLIHWISMPHQCVHCSKVYDKAGDFLISGCDSCKGRFFFYIKEEQLDKVKEEPVEIAQEEKVRVEKDIREMAGITDEKAPVILDIESVRVLKPGKFEIDIVNLFKKDRPLIFKLEEGKYIIDLSSMQTEKK